jgi:hypothetical protein
MKVSQFFRKFFGLSPIVGDSVSGSLDWSVSYSGVVVSTPTNCLFPCYIVKGAVSIITDWKGIETKKESEIIVPANRINHA